MLCVCNDRLTPTLAVLILFLTLVMPNMNQGPVWFKLEQMHSWCQSYWWTDLLYINNFVPDGARDVRVLQTCQH